MSWNWSHSEEAYTNARANIRDLDVSVLSEVYIEIVTYRLSLKIENLIRAEAGETLEECPVCPDNYFDDKVAERISASERLADMIESHNNSAEEFTELSEFIWEFATHHQECSNGGHNAYICPYNCHSVPFDRED